MGCSDKKSEEDEIQDLSRIVQESKIERDIGERSEEVMR